MPVGRIRGRGFWIGEMIMDLHLINRRKFVSVASSLLVGSGLAGGSKAAPPAVKRPRATDGDERFEPNWD